MAALTRDETALLEGRADVVAGEILAERHRQLLEEGFTLKSDERHSVGALASAAAAYALAADGRQPLSVASALYPWDNPEKLEGKDTRRRLIIAAALLMAAVERLDREHLIWPDTDAS
jgi:hypothetical protein